MDESVMISWVLDIESNTGKVWRSMKRDLRRIETSVEDLTEAWGDGLGDTVQNVFTSAMTRMGQWKKNIVLHSQGAMTSLKKLGKSMRENLGGEGGKDGIGELGFMAKLAAMGEGLEALGNKTSAAFSTATDETQSYIESLNQVNQYLGLSRKELRQFKIDGVEAAKRTGAGLNEVGAALLALTDAGFANREVMIELSGDIANMATATTLSVETASKMAYRLSDDFGYATDQISATFEMLRVAGQTTAADTNALGEQLLNQMSIMGGALKRMTKEESESVMSSMTALTASLVDNWAETGSAISDTIAQAMGGDMEARRQLAALGLPFEELEKRLKSGDLSGLFDPVMERLKGMGEESRKAFLEATGIGLDLSSLANLESNYEGIEEDLVRLADANKQVYTESDKASEKLSEAANQNRTLFEQVAKKVSTAVASMNVFGHSGAEVLDMLKEINPVSVYATAQLAMVATKGLGSIVRYAGPAVGSLGKLTTAFKVMGNVFMKATPLGRLLMIAGAFIALLPILKKVGAFVWKYLGWPLRFIWDKILKPIGKFILKVILAPFRLIGKVVMWIYQKVFKPLGAQVKAIGKALGGVMLDGMKIILKVGKEVLSFVFGPIFKVVGGLAKLLFNLVKPVFDAIAKVGMWLYEKAIKPIWEVFAAIGSYLGDKLTPAFQFIGKIISKVFLGPLQAIGNIIGYLVGKVKSFIKSTFGWVIKVLKWMGIISEEEINADETANKVAENANAQSNIISESDIESMNTEVQGATNAPMDYEASSPPVVVNAKTDSSELASATMTASQRETQVLQWGFSMLARKLDALAATGSRPAPVRRAGGDDEIINGFTQ